MLQLGAIVQASIALAVSEGILNIKGLNPQASWDRIGRYARLSNESGAGFWFGIHFELWKKYERTPLWLIFSSTNFGRADAIRSKLEPWATKMDIVTSNINDEFVVGMDIPTGDERDQVVRFIVDRLKEIHDVSA
jgi:hypothetical protein